MMKLQTKITVILSLIIMMIIGVFTYNLYGIWFSSIQNQVAMDAMDEATFVSEQAVVKDHINLSNGYIYIQPAMETIRLKTRVQYIYVINEDGRFFSHPLPEQLNQYSDTRLDNYISIQEPEYIYDVSREAIVEGYAPIYADGIQSGIVVVGFYNGRIIQTMESYLLQVILFAVLMILVSILVSFFLAKNIKKAIFGLEPEAIAVLMRQRQLVMENMDEGILATDRDGNIQLMNDRLKQLLKLPNLEMGSPMSDYDFYRFAAENAGMKPVEWRLETGEILQIETKELKEVHHKLGLLLRIEDRSIVIKKAEAMTNMEQLTQALRAQNHEFMNKLQTIYGLLLLDEFEQAQDYIEQVTENQQAIIQALNKRIMVPAVSALLLAKYSQLIEKDITLEIRTETYLEALPPHVLEDDMTTILGNLLDNGMDALEGIEDGRIGLMLKVDKEALWIVVHDNGPGCEDVHQMITKGYSTKGINRGYGLYIVTHKIHQLGGTYEITNEDGLRWQIRLPIEKKEA